MKNILTFTFLLGLFSCSDSEYYKVQFDNVDRLTEGDKVILKGLEVGQVKNLELDDQKRILVTIWIGRNVKLTRGSTFTIHGDLWGTRHIEVALADNPELMDTEEVQKGAVQPPDKVGVRHYTAQERDSLIEHNSALKLADTLITILRKSRDSTRND